MTTGTRARNLAAGKELAQESDSLLHGWFALEALDPQTRSLLTDAARKRAAADVSAGNGGGR